MKSVKIFLLFFIVIHIIAAVVGVTFYMNKSDKSATKGATKQKELYWFMLKRKSNTEILYRGVPGDLAKSKVVKEFVVKTGIPGERPTPLPKFSGRKYWLIIDKIEQYENPETAPYFLTLDVPGTEEEPFGPSPYLECGPASQRGEQCSWILPGAFGLHGINGDTSRLEKDNPGSSGCIRHTDEDIAYLYNLLDPKKEKIRYYIEDV